MSLRRLIVMCSGVLVLSACSEMDMQGHDPRAYYEKNPIKNKVVSKTEAHTVHFVAGATRLSTNEREAFRHKVNQRSMLGTEAVVIEMAPSQMGNSERKTSLEKMMKVLGYHGTNLSFKASSAVGRDDAVIRMTFAEVVLPNCPDWRKSPNHNYSNTQHANIGCASETNLGLMVADPHDLVRGTGELPPALSERGDRVLKDYRGGKDYTGGSSDAAAAESAAGAQTDTTSAAPSAFGE